MRLWSAASRDLVCGYRGCAIAAGQPMQIIRIGGLPDRLRCQEHAQGPVDWTQIDHDQRAINAERDEPAVSHRMLPLRSVMAAVDLKQRQTGERDE